MSFPLWYLLVPFALVVLGSGIFLFFNLYHIAKFGLQSFATTLVLLAYLGSYVAVLGASLALLGRYDWQREVTISDISPFLDGGSASSYF